MPPPPCHDDTLLGRVTRAISPWNASAREATFMFAALVTVPFMIPMTFVGRDRLSMGWGLALALAYLSARWLVRAFAHTRIGPARCAACAYPRPDQNTPPVCSECGSDWHAHGGITCRERTIEHRCLALGLASASVFVVFAGYIFA